MTHLTHVAIKFQGTIYSLPKPNRHHHVIWHIVNITKVSHVDNEEQGFLDNEGNFFTREEALVIALESKQVKDLNNIRAGKLFSEDLW